MQTTFWRVRLLAPGRRREEAEVDAGESASSPRQLRQLASPPQSSPISPCRRRREEAEVDRTNPRSSWGIVPLTLFHLLLFPLLLAGCFRHEPRADLTIVNGAEPETLDPATVTGQPEMRIVQGLFEGLTRLDPVTGGAIPGLAASWDVSPDQRVYTFHLRPGLEWSTGEPLTASDLWYSWRRALDPATACDYAGQLFCITNAEAFNAGRIRDPALLGFSAPDPLTFRVVLTQPTPYFLDLCALPILSAVPRQAIEPLGDAWLKARPLPVSGPFGLVDWRLNDRVRLKRNPRYWDDANTQSDLIDLLPIGAANVALNLYITGEADIVWDKELVPAELVDLLVQRPDFHRFDYLGTYFIRFNVTRKPFDDPRVRKALALAIDKKRLMERISKLGEQPADHLVPDIASRYQPPAGLGYDPAAARRLLAEAGYPGGKGFPRFEYMFNAASGGSSKIHERIAVELQQMWRDELGISMELRQLEWKVYLSAQDQLDYDLSRSSWIGDYDDPNTFLSIFTSNDGNNRTGWKNTRYDELISQANLQTNRVDRAAMLAQAESILVHDEVPIIPLFYYKGLNYFDPQKIQGIYQNRVDQHPLQSIRKLAPDAGLAADASRRGVKH